MGQPFADVSAAEAKPVSNHGSIALLEKLCHVGSRLRFAGIGGQPKSLHHQSKRVLVLVDLRGLISRFRELRADCNPRYSPASVSIVIMGRIESDDQQSAILEGTALDEWIDISLQPGVGYLEPTIMRVVAQIWSDERIIGEIVVRQIGRELREWYQIQYLGFAVDDIKKKR